MLHRLGYRFRLQLKAAPGRPDVAFPARRKIIFVHGCFWHQHEGCRSAQVPATRRAFWEAKFESNKARDARDLERAEAGGWQAIVVWECETRQAEALESRLSSFLGSTRHARE
jgi:DNA mismatch endonuclease (patch repair protein)